MEATKWTLQHEDGRTQTRVEPKDSRGLILARGCGYVWANKNDGFGWRQVSSLVREAVNAESRAALSEGK